MSKNLNETTGYKVAGLTADLMQKLRNDNMSIQQLENFLQLSFNEREEKFGRVVDMWASARDSNTLFYKEVFGIDVDCSIAIPTAPEDFTGPLFIPKMKGDTAVKAYEKLFGEDSMYQNDYSKNVDACIKSQQARPDAPYFIRHRDGVEPDKIHLNKSYNDFCKDGNSYMVPLEGILFALYYRWSTGNMIDVKGVTRFHALASDVGVLDMHRGGDGRFLLDWDFRVNRNFDRGPRQVNF